MSFVSGTLIDTGVDWITCTFSDKKNADLALNHAAGLMLSEHAAGDDKQLWSMYGYEGFKCGGIRFGSRAQDSCVMLSGPLAQQKWQTFYHLASNVSRLDLQATFRYDIPSSRKLAIHYKAASRARRQGKSRRRVTLLRSTDGSATIYLGSRQSDAFGRAYQKDAESRLDHYLDSIRYEMETKNDLARRMAKTISETSSPQSHIASQVKVWFEVSSIYLPMLSEVHNSFTGVSRCRRDDYSRLEWLTTDVRPAVQNLLARDKLPLLLDALGLSDHVIPKRSRSALLQRSAA
jgi:hypothetical protein